MICRVLLHEDADGPGNMARDEALLDAVAASPTGAVFRTYGWTEPTLSLGYFQAIAEAEADPRWRDVPTVRRPTGGGAIWHHHELTYALAVPRTHPMATRAAELYRAVHAAIAETLRGRGVVAVRRGPTAADPPPARPLLCFTDRDDEDLVVRGVKVVGSAQRRRRGAVLQHGSLLLGRSVRTPELPGLGDLADAATTVPSWSALLRSRIPEALGLHARDGEPTAEERARASALEREVYRNPAWTRRR
jgi:lipoate-protein ligase A